MRKMSKFKIPAIPHTTPKCVRFPDDLIEEIEEVIKSQDCTFSAFILEAVRFALKDIKNK